MMLLYSLALAASLAVSAPLWGVRMLREGRYREGLGQRLGRVPASLRRAAEGRRVLWLHAVSVGEVLAAAGLVAALEGALPGCLVVISTTTSTGQRVARERFGADRVFFFPLDFGFAVRAYLSALRPEMLILMESELWPRMLAECERTGAPVVVANARVSDRSLGRYMALRRLWRPLLRRIALLLAQTDEDARRWLAIGAAPAAVQAVGNLKYDVAPDAATPVALHLREHLPEALRVLVCGSTHEGEEAMLLACWTAPASSDAVMLLAPRHPQRCEAIATDLRRRGLASVRLSDWAATPATIARGTVVLVDTIGQLAGLYSLASVAFVGGSLVPSGGHNPLEPARFGVPVLMGPHFENFREMTERMLAANAIRMVTENDLCAVLTDAMAGEGDPLAAMGGRARAFAESQRGATARTVDAILPLLRSSR